MTTESSGPLKPISIHTIYEEKQLRKTHMTILWKQGHIMDIEGYGASGG